MTARPTPQVGDLWVSGGWLVAIVRISLQGTVFYRRRPRFLGTTPHLGLNAVSASTFAATHQLVVRPGAVAVYRRGRRIQWQGGL